jgi:hypothetical protein
LAERTSVDAKLRAEWFEVDRWTTSSAVALPLEARGLYREMLSQAWVRGARLPLEPEAIRRVTYTTVEEWARAWPHVATYWRELDGALVNDTQLGIYADAKARADRASERGRHAVTARWGKPVGPRPVEDKPAKVVRWKFSSLYVSPKMHEYIKQAVGKAAERLDWDALYERAACDYAEKGAPANKLDDLQARARKTLEARRDLLTGPPSVEATAAKLAEPVVELTPAQRADAAARMRKVLAIR